jgi:Na+-transporting methylmalonyl-CoA/oxaloacetate decarboxylase gamma subunit
MNFLLYFVYILIISQVFCQVKICDPKKCENECCSSTTSCQAKGETCVFKKAEDMKCLTEVDCPEGHKCLADEVASDGDVKITKKHCSENFSTGAIAVVIIYIILFITAVILCVWGMKKLARKRRDKRVSEEQEKQRWEEKEMQEEIIRNQQAILRN